MEENKDMKDIEGLIYDRISFDGGFLSLKGSSARGRMGSDGCTVAELRILNGEIYAAMARDGGPAPTEGKLRRTWFTASDDGALTWVPVGCLDGESYAITLAGIAEALGIPIPNGQKK